MKAAILTSDFCQDEEYTFPYYRLLEYGFELDVVLSPHKNNLNPKCKYGTPILWNKLSIDVVKNNYDLIIIPGGFAPEIVRLDESALNIVSKALNNKKIIGAICHGPQILLSLVNKNHNKYIMGEEMTGFIGIKDDIENAGFTYKVGVIKQNNIITADHYRENPLFMKTILKEFNI